MLAACDVTTPTWSASRWAAPSPSCSPLAIPSGYRPLTLIATSPDGERSSTEQLPRSEPRVANDVRGPRARPAMERSPGGRRLPGRARTTVRGNARVRRRAWLAPRRPLRRARTTDMAASVANHWLVDEDPADQFRMSDIAVPPSCSTEPTTRCSRSRTARRSPRRSRSTVRAVGRHGPRGATATAVGRRHP